MKRLVLASVLVLLSSFPSLARANPVPDAVAARFRDNVLITSREGHCPDSTSLVADFSAFGMDLLSPQHITAMEENFRAFAPLIVASQRPGNHRNLSFELQGFYWLHASPRQRADMLSALREWLSAEMSEAPAGGSMRIVEPPEQVRRVIDVVRATAAEMLSDRGDSESLPLMAALERRGLEDPHALFVLRRAMARFRHPCAMTFLEETPRNGLQCCESLSRVRRISLGGGDWRYPRPKYTLDSREVHEFWRLMQGARKGSVKNGFGGRPALLFEFQDGVLASLSPTKPGQLAYTDNVTLDRRQQLTLQSDSLYNWVQRLARAKLDEGDR